MPVYNGVEFPEGVTEAEAKEFLSSGPSMYDKAKKFVGGLLDSASGDKTTEFKDVSEYVPRKGPEQLGLLSTADTAAQVDIISKHNPGATFGVDKYNNVIVDIKGQGNPKDISHLNKPGVSPLDVGQTLNQGLAYFHALNPLKNVSGYLPRVAGATAVGGATSMGLDGVSIASGSNQGVNLENAIVTGGITGTLEAALPWLRPLTRAITRNPVYFTPTKGLTEKGKQALMDKGLKIEEIQKIGPLLAEEFQRMAKSHVDPVQALRQAQANMLPVPPKLTAGQATGNPRLQMTEDNMRKGNYGEEPMTILKGHDAQATEALQANIPAIQSRLANGQPQVVNRGDSGAIVQNKLTEINNVVGKQVDDLYKQAEATQAGVTIDTGLDIAVNITDSAHKYLRHNTPIANKLNDDLIDLMANAEQRDIQANIQALHDWRRDVSTMANKVSDRTEAAALSTMKREFDLQLKEKLKKGLIDGHQDSIELWSKAINKRAQKGRLFEDGDLVGDLVETEIKGSSRPRLKVAPEAASNYILGQANMGFVNRPQLVREMNKVKRLLGHNSPEWNAVREEIWLRIASNTRGAVEGADFAFSGAKLKKSWDNFGTQNPHLRNLIFNKSEQELIENFANTATRITSPVKGGANFSNTTSAAANIFQKLGDALFMGEKGKAWLSRLPLSGYGPIQTTRAWQSTKPPALPDSQLIPAAGATMAD